MNLFIRIFCYSTNTDFTNDVPMNERFLKHAFFSLQFDFPEA